MRNGDPDFALAAAMAGTAYHSHPYGHETIGYREDIERYNATSLDRFYRLYYRPDNAVMMIVGDVDEKTALAKVKKHFSAIQKPAAPILRFHISEPAQEGLRRVIVKRPSELNIVSFGVKHAGFPSESWYVASTLLEVLTGGPESILHLALVDNGIATNVDGSLEPTSEENIGSLSITLAPDSTHEGVEEMVRVIIDRLDNKTVTPLLKKIKAKLLTDELFARDSSLRITDELTEYVASGNWTAYAKTPEILDRITVKMLLDAAQTLFNDTTMTIGYFIGTRS
jgi:zinc protease